MSTIFFVFIFKFCFHDYVLYPHTKIFDVWYFDYYWYGGMGISRLKKIK